jgi:hypothetical protein
MKKIFFALTFLLFVTVSGFSQMGNIGVMGSYNSFNPSFWGVGYMLMISGNDYDDICSHFFRFGSTGIGGVTQTYERENIYNSNNEMTEYWQKSVYLEFFTFGYAFQVCFVDFFALRIGADLYISYAPAYSSPSDITKSNTSSAYDGFNLGLAGIAGLVLFPKKQFFISVDACPGYQLNTFYGKFKNAKEYDSDFSFVMPIRLTAGINLGR